VDGVDDTCGPAKGSKVGVWKGVGKMGVFESAVKIRCIEEEEEKERKGAPKSKIVLLRCIISLSRTLTTFIFSI
jgi:hypothetical protein